MINRTYFYSAKVYTDNPKFISGVIEVRSFLPDPRLVFRETLEHIAKDFSLEDKSKISIERFNKI